MHTFQVLARLTLPLCVVVCSAQVAQADAREHFLRGEAAYSQGNYELAIQEWKKAYRLESRPRIQHNLALAYERLGQLAEAVRALKLYLERARPRDPAYGDATARLKSLEQRLSRTGVKIVGGAEGALIFVDGREWGRTPRPDKIPVDAGSHNIVIRHAGYQDFESNVVVPAGQVVEVRVQMKKKPGKDSSTRTFFSDEPASEGIAAQGQQNGAEAADEGQKPQRFFEDDHAGPSESESDPLTWYLTSAGLAVGTIGAAIWTAERAGELSACDNREEVYCRNEDTVRKQRDFAFLVAVLLAGGSIGTLVYALMLDAENGKAEHATEQAASCVPGWLGAECAFRF